MATVRDIGPRLGIAPTCAALGLPRATFYRRLILREGPSARRQVERAGARRGTAGSYLPGQLLVAPDLGQVCPQAKGAERAAAVAALERPVIPDLHVQEEPRRRVGGSSPSGWPDRQETQSDSHIPSPCPHPFPAKSQRLPQRDDGGTSVDRPRSITLRQTRSTPKVRLFDFGDCGPPICTSDNQVPFRALPRVHLAAAIVSI
jgi:hypothetical protein